MATTTTSYSPFNMLPYELLLMIFEHMGPLDLNKSVASKAICHLWHKASNDKQLWHSFMHLHISTDLHNSWGGISCASTMCKKVVCILNTEHKAQTDINNDTAWIMLRTEQECQMMVTTSLGQCVIEVCSNSLDVLLKNLLETHPESSFIKSSSLLYTLGHAIMGGNVRCLQVIHDCCKNDMGGRCVIQHVDTVAFSMLVAIN
jgi:hypothetical protein